MTVTAAVPETALPPSPRTFAQRQQIRRNVLAQGAVFGVGALSFVQIANFTATGLSIACLLLVPGYLFVGQRAVDLVPVVLAALGWLGYLVACVVNGADPFGPTALAPLAFGLYVMGLTVLVGRSIRSILTVLAGIAAGTVLYHVIWGIELTNTGSFLDLWKYGIAGAVTILVLFVLVVLGVRPAFHPLALGLLAVVSLVFNYRSHALICLVAAMLLFTGRVIAPRVGRGWQYVAVFGGAAVFAVLMPIVARAGLLGSALQAKIAQQDASHLPILFAGRTEPPLSFTAIAAHPLVGWGSVDRVTPEVVTDAVHLAIRLGYAPTLPFDLYWRIPPDYTALHSILLGSWAEGGVLALLLPVWLLGACVALMWNHPRFGVWSAMVVTVAIQGIWDLLYSPWSYNLLPVYACIALLFVAMPPASATTPAPRVGRARRGFGWRRE
ncbi:hypothetical protein OG921_00620 [Aldersonia sp. NBC_00410]|uniref:hypothetical protein n=1 Tax=Aldersonia sp. NBC_00410 TaxID=2975954 RepID=UPI00224ED2FA|nr:hypothetical protein [Aldersonia sp. NBC_00410]MCX5041692.1 hypothetical protein [Aldersonia sp. NBC_00410]